MKPIKTFRAGRIESSIWNNEKMQIVSIRKSWKVEDEWKYQKINFSVADIPKLKAVLDETYKYLIVNGYEQGNQDQSQQKTA